MEVLLSAVGALLLVPVAVFAVEVAIAMWGSRIARVTAGARPALSILIPAHNEESGIHITLRSIVPQLTAQDRLVVVADNCTDGTRRAAAAEGAEVICRVDADRRGKGYALDHGVQHLRLSPPEIVIIIDADCHVAPGAIDLLARMCAECNRPVQAQYVMRNEGTAPLKMRVAEFAWLVKNRVRPLGLAKLGLPCLLTGSGMAFPWSSISRINMADGHLAEDMKLGLDLARLGVAPIFCPEALVVSAFPTQHDGIEAQRTRWEHGHLGTILSEAPSLLIQGMKQVDLGLIALAVDICVPPLALLVLQLALLWLVTMAFYAATGLRAPALIANLVAAAFAVAVFAAWAGHGRRVISLKDLLSGWTYPLGKISIYSRFVFARQKEWVRSARNMNLGSASAHAQVLLEESQLRVPPAMERRSRMRSSATIRGEGLVARNRESRRSRMTNLYPWDGGVEKRNGRRHRRSDDAISPLPLQAG